MSNQTPTHTLPECPNCRTSEHCREIACCGTHQIRCDKCGSNSGKFWTVEAAASAWESISELRKKYVIAFERLSRMKMAEGLSKPSERIES